MSDCSGSLQAALADRYVFQRELGHGGMATVYLAEDVRHRRAVAIKVLKPEIARTARRRAVPARDRDRRPAAASAHPAAVRLRRGGPDGRRRPACLCYAMPFVEGESLRARLTREKQLPDRGGGAVAREVAGRPGLRPRARRGPPRHQAREHPALRGTRVVADFGIAPRRRAAGGERLTEHRLTIGTPAYMSPEQAAGEPALDGRSDHTVSAACVYEMLAGTPPFPGPTPGPCSPGMPSTPFLRSEPCARRSRRPWSGRS